MTSSALTRTAPLSSGVRRSCTRVQHRCTTGPRPNALNDRSLFTLQSLRRQTGVSIQGTVSQRRLATSVTRTGAGNGSTEATTTEGTAWLTDYLKFDSAPTFDVLEKTKEYTSMPAFKAFRLKEVPLDLFDDDYLFRGPIVGPINRKDLIDANNFFELDKRFPDLERKTFGHTVDPENPYRVHMFERWEGTFSGDIAYAGIPVAEATGEKCITPVSSFSVSWTPNGKIIYESLGPAVDRFDGNTKGKVAVFGLLEFAGISLNPSIGNPMMWFQLKYLGSPDSPLPGGATYSRPEDIPKWWKSKAVVNEPNDM